MPGKDMTYPEVDDTPHHVTAACKSLSVEEETPRIPSWWECKRQKVPMSREKQRKIQDSEDVSQMPNGM
jgi:hypothetical protein